MNFIAWMNSGPFTGISLHHWWYCLFETVSDLVCLCITINPVIVYLLCYANTSVVLILYIPLTMPTTRMYVFLWMNILNWSELKYWCELERTTHYRHSDKILKKVFLSPYRHILHLVIMVWTEIISHYISHSKRYLSLLYNNYCITIIIQ